MTLRARTDADLDVLFALAADLPTWEERGPTPPAPLTRAAFDDRLAKADLDGEGNVRFVIDVDGVAVGSVGLFGVDPLARHAEVGIAILPEARGRGVGSAAVEQILEFAFVRQNLRRLHLEAIASNLGAIRAYEKAGFVIEGRQREHAWVRGHVRGHRPDGAAPVRVADADRGWRGLIAAPLSARARPAARAR